MNLIFKEIFKKFKNYSYDFVVIFVFYEIYICMFFDIDYIYVFKLIGV